jgi:hypothetical protein
MRRLPAVLTLAACLLPAACGEAAEPVAASPAAPASSPAPVPAESTSAPEPAASAPKSEPHKDASPTASVRSAAPSSRPKRKSSPKPAASDRKSDPDAACDAAAKADDRLYPIRAANGPAKVGDDASAAEVAAAVQALITGHQANVRAVTSARGLTTDAEVRAALADLIAARKAVIALLNAAGTDAKKKNAALNTPDELVASVNLWTYPDGLCVSYVD